MLVAGLGSTKKQVARFLGAVARGCSSSDARLQLHAFEIGGHVDEGAVSWHEPHVVEAQVYDEISGALLGPKLVQQARRQAIDFVIIPVRCLRRGPGCPGHCQGESVTEARGCQQS
jgi:hypothetical protein